MTAAQVRKLETILGKLEALEAEVRDSRIREDLNGGKRTLLEALRRADRARGL